MAFCACTGASMQCSFGVAPSTLNVLPTNKCMTATPIANIMDNKAMVNIPPFGMCNSPLNPATKRPPPVFFTPAPCTPVIAAPWAPGAPTVMLANQPILNNTSKLLCNWGGVIQILSPGQTTIMTP